MINIIIIKFGQKTNSIKRVMEIFSGKTIKIKIKLFKKKIIKLLTKVKINKMI